VSRNDAPAGAPDHRRRSLAKAVARASNAASCNNGDRRRSGSCADARDHLFVVTRGFQRSGITTTDGTQSIASPPVLEFDAAGAIVNSWGDATLTESGGNAVMPNATHGCFVDFENNVWIGGNGDGVLQKWSRDGKLLANWREGHLRRRRSAATTTGRPDLVRATESRLPDMRGAGAEREPHSTEWGGRRLRRSRAGSDDRAARLDLHRRWLRQ
jgi:hypothetical protein